MARPEPFLPKSHSKPRVERGGRPFDLFVTAGQVRDCIGARKAIQQNMTALEMSLRGLLRNFGLKVGAISRGRFEVRIRELADGNPVLETATAAMLRARASLRQELAGSEKRVRQFAGDDPVCRLMTMPGIGAVVALTFRAAVDDPARFRSSERVGPWVGLTPSRNQSGERDVSGGIAKAGDVNLRRALCQAATVMMNRGRPTWLRKWGARLAQRRGRKIAMAGLARRIAVILHRIWVDDTTFRADAALTTNRSMYPKDLSRRQPESRDRHARIRANRFGGSVQLHKIA